MTFPYDRGTYYEIKSFFLDDYFSHCREFAVRNNKNFQEIIALVAYQWEGVFQRKSEKIMANTILYIMNGGWSKNASSYYIKEIESALKAEGIGDLLAEASSHEAVVFLSDLVAIPFDRVLKEAVLEYIRLKKMQISHV